MKQLFSILSLFLFSTTSFSQNNQHKIDSLQNVLKTQDISDSVRIGTNYELARKHLNSDPEKTLFYTSEAIELAGKGTDKYSKKIKGESYSLQGVVYKNKGDYKTAIEKHLQSLKIKEEQNDTSGRAIAYNDIGILYKQMKNFPKALECYRMSNILLQQVGRKVGVSFTYGNIGTIHSEMKDLDSALYYYNKALKIAEEINNRDALTTAYTNIGEIYGKRGESAKALEYFKKSLLIDTENNDVYGMILSYTNVGTALKDLGKYNEALENFYKAEKHCIESGATPLLKDLYFVMSESFNQAKDPAKAYLYLSRYTKLNDSILNTETTKQMSELDAKYQSEKKDKELIMKDAEIKTQQADASKKAIQRNAILAGLVLVLGLAFFIFRGYRQKKKANVEITLQKEIIEEKNKEITDSIHYAKRIQKALLASENTLGANLPEHFVLYKPKDIVSGDFYWAQNINGNFLISTADCTGHGVPGAFMSLLGISYLNEITRERHINNPAQVLDKLRSEIILNLNAEDEHSVNDGMDMTLCNFRLNEMRLEFACANNPLWLVRNKELIEFKPDKYPVGNHHGELKPFTNQTLELQKGDIIYTLTDGYADQFGGPNGKKFKYKALQETLLNISDKPMEDQKQILDMRIESWKGKLEQVDDILIIGIRV